MLQSDSHTYNHPPVVLLNNGLYFG